MTFLQNKNVKLWHTEVYMPKECLVQVKKQKKMLIDNGYTKSLHIITDRLNNSKFDHKHDYNSKQLESAIFRMVYSDVEPFEVETTNSKVTKYVIRIEFDDLRDISIVVRGNVIITAWINYKDDKHYTLDKSKYAKKEDWKF